MLSSLVICAAIIMASASPRALQGLSGDLDCPCINPWQGGYPSSMTYVDQATSRGCLKMEPSPGAPALCYPMDYGSSECRQWDATLPPKCADQDGNPLKTAPDWCKSEWCYVNKSNCVFQPSTSEFFKGHDLFFSYESCGSINRFAPELLVQSLKGRKLRVGTPRHSTLPWLGFDGDKPIGVTPDYWVQMAEAAGMILEWRTVSNESRTAHPTSQGTACVRDVALKRVDTCLGGFWENLERRLYTSVTPIFYTDAVFLVVYAKQGTDLVEDILKIFKPFSAELWAVMIAACIVVGTSMWFFDHRGDKHIVTGSIDGLRKAIMMFLGQANGADDSWEQASLESKIIAFGFGLMCMISSAYFTANLASILLLNNIETGLKDIEDAIAQKASVKVCAISPLKSIFVAKYPSDGDLLVTSKNFKVAVEEMDAGICQGMLLPLSVYGQMRSGIGAFEDAPAHCDKMKVGDAAFTIPASLPINFDISHAVSVMVMKDKMEGALDTLLENYPVPESTCPDPGLKQEAEPITPRDMAGVMLILAIAIAVAFALHVFHRLMAKKIQKMSERICERTNSKKQSSSGEDSAAAVDAEAVEVAFSPQPDAKGDNSIESLNHRALETTAHNMLAPISGRLDQIQHEMQEDRKKSQNDLALLAASIDKIMEASFNSTQGKLSSF